jgi:general secretion pathway protein N
MVRPPVAASAAVAPPTPVPSMQPQPTTQDAQIEAIRRRIEARRAQMRAEAQGAGSQNR